MSSLPTAADRPALSMLALCFRRPWYSSLKCILFLMNSATTRFLEGCGVHVNHLALVELLGSGHALRQRRRAFDVSVDVLLVYDVEQTFPTEQVLEVEIVGLLILQRCA
jgi:hypothetical protein